MPTGDRPLWLSTALSLADLVASSSDGRRLVEQGGVELDGKRILDPRHELARGGEYLVRVGSKKRRFCRIKVPL